MTHSTADANPIRPALVSMPLVWMYHSVAPYDDDPYEVTMTPQRFVRQMTWLRNRRLRGVSMTTLLAAHARGRARGMVGLTFDDGYRDFLPHALPVLLRHGFTATLFILAGRLGGSNDWSRPGPVKPLLSADDLREIGDAGMEIGSHGLRHVRLPEVDDSELRAEVTDSRLRLQDVVGRDVPGFCYPYGDLDDRVVRAVRSAGYDYGCAVGAGPQIGRHAIPRTLVHERDTSWRLEAKRVVSTLTVGNRHGVRHLKGGQ
jgi:peptidoglycan/xylan/chitin deacetylase (PgdA/CDA1 family)